MSKHFTNAAYGVLDYASYPIGMLLVAPVVLHKLGASEYGLWIIATALISAGGIIASGFCDANIPHAPRNESGKPCIWIVVHSSGSDQDGIVLLPELDKELAERLAAKA